MWETLSYYFECFGAMQAHFYDVDSNKIIIIIIMKVMPKMMMW